VQTEIRHIEIILSGFDLTYQLS